MLRRVENIIRDGRPVYQGLEEGHAWCPDCGYTPGDDLCKHVTKSMGEHRKLELVSPDRPESDEMFTSDEFVECDTCRAIPGSPTLCYGCLSNRHLIGKLQIMLDAAKLKPLSARRMKEVFQSMWRRVR